MQGFLRTYADIDLQEPMDAAVVIPTVLRPHLKQALHSIFAQRFPGRIHILSASITSGATWNSSMQPAWRAHRIVSCRCFGPAFPPRCAMAA